jgi:hypothetical protein
MTVCNTQTSGLHPSSGILKNTTFGKVDLLPSSGEGWEAPTQLGLTSVTGLWLALSSRYLNTVDGQFRKLSNPEMSCVYI